MYSLVAAATAAAAVSCAGGTTAASGPGAWTRVEPGGRTACARGGRYAFWVRRARADRLVVFFQGGGGCFDTRTCAPGSTWFDDRVGAEDSPTLAGGIFDFANPRNPFRDWSFVFIPSCTGDVHLGDRRTRYGPTLIQHRGWVNARAALEWTFRNVRRPTTVLVTGCSAGSVGSAFHVPAVISRYPNARVTYLGDSLAFLFHRPVRLVDWGAPRHFPAFFRIGDRRFTMAEYLRALAKRYPARRFARFNYASDDVQERFYAAVGGDPSKFSRQLRLVERNLANAAPNYRSYLACGSSHCVLPLATFYSLTVGRTSLRNWVASLAGGRSARCVECKAR